MWYQLPPRDFWVWACGGLSVVDAVIIAAWTALNVVYVWQRVAFIMPLFKGVLLVLAVVPEVQTASTDAETRVLISDTQEFANFTCH